MIDNLVVYPEAMLANLDRLGGLHESQRVLLALTHKGMSRENAYECVQRHAMRAWRGDGIFRDLLRADEEIAGHLTGQEIDALFEPGYHLKHVDTIFARVFGRSGS